LAPPSSTISIAHDIAYTQECAPHCIHLRKLKKTLKKPNLKPFSKLKCNLYQIPQLEGRKKIAKVVM
jgi:hypothetical protein